MRPRLKRLLTAAGVAPDAFAEWERILIVSSYGSLSLSNANRTSYLWNRGMHLVLVSDAGEPTHYCKFRPLRPDGVPHRESVLLERFSAHAASAPVVPSTTVASDDRLTVQVTRFVHGPRMDTILETISAEEVEPLTNWVLSAASSLSDAAKDFPDLFPRLGGRPVDLEAESTKPLSLLAKIGVTARDGETLRTALDQAGEVPAITQHRDLWPKNVVRDPSGKCHIVDFDDYGTIIVPLYDALHLVRSIDDILRPDDRRPWLERLAEGTPRAGAMRAVIRAAAGRVGLSRRQTVGCLLFYLLDFPMSIYLRETTVEFWGSYRDELPVAAAWLRESPSLDAFGERLLFTP